MTENMAGHLEEALSCGGSELSKNGDRYVKKQTNRETV